MKLIQSNFRQVVPVAIFIILLVFNTLHAQNASVCPVGVGMEPRPTSETRSTNFVSEVYFQYFEKWNNLRNLKFSDDKRATTTLTNINKSRQFLGNNLKFQIPDGATIHGITLMVEGQSSSYQNIDEVEIFLTGKDGSPKGENRKNTAKGQKAWKTDRDGKDHVWMYGSATDTWGTIWKASDINDGNFGYQIQIRSIINDTIQVAIDQIKVIVDYTPAYSFCDDKCLTFYIDKYEQYGSYIWHTPQGFNMVSASPYYQTIDLKINGAAFGMYNVCVDVYDYDGDFVERCCRDFLYQDCESSSIEGKFWQDFNNNQLRDPGEGVLANVAVVLYSQAGLPVDTVVTDAAGNYAFTKLKEGKYYIKAPTMADKSMVTYNAIDPDFNSDFTHQNGQGTSDLISIGVGEKIYSIDFGYTPLVTLGDFVWIDQNFNGLQDASEQGFADATVQLHLSDGSIYASTTSDSNGSYQFTNIPANSYYLSFVVPSEWMPTTQNLSSDLLNSKIDAQKRTPLKAYTQSGTYSNLDAGFFKSGTIGDRVWEDVNGNGQQDVGENGIANVGVTLIGTTGSGQAVSLNTSTDIHGIYQFSGLFPGQYALNFTLPIGYHFTMSNAVADDADSDVVNGKIDHISILSGDSNQSYDAGMYQFGQVGDLVWHDLNADGIYQSGEPGLENIRLTLYQIVGSDSIEVKSTLTDANGLYRFDSLLPGRYYITVQNPAQHSFTLANVGDDQTDSDVVNGIIGSFQVLSGDNNATLDAGLVKTGRIGDFVWHDLNGNGLQDANEPGIVGIQVTLNGTTYLGHPVSKTTFSFTDGQYIFENLLPGTYSVKATLSQGYLFTTSDLGNDQIDADGVNGEVTGILMTSGDNISRVDFGLYKPSEIGDLIWEDTNGNGLNDNGESGLDQINLTLNGQAGDGSIQHQQTTTDATGNYKFSNLKPGHYTIQMTLPNGYTLTQANLGNDDIDSDFDANLQATVSVQSGVSDLNIDGGLIRQASIGDYIWHDQNANGIQDSNEAGMKDVEVSLTGTTNTGQQITLTTFTDMDGKYQFSSLMPGTYEIKINAPAGFVFSLNHIGGNNLDSDADQNGVISNILLVSGQNNDTYDAGLITHSSIGDFVWEDMNGNGIQDPQEQGIANIEVNLNGTDVFNQQVVKSTTSDASGQYIFTDLLPGNYSLSISKPGNYEFTAANQGNTDVDSDFINGSTNSIQLVSDDHRKDIDAGLFLPSNLGDFVWVDLNANGMQDAGEPGLEGVNVVLSGTSGSGQSIQKTTVTDTNGRYNFDLLPPGSYQISMTAPSSYYWTGYHIGNTDLDSDALQGVISNIQLTSGINIQNLDAGLYQGASLGDFVWVDANVNGLQDASELGLQDVALTLSGQDGLGNAVNQSTTTDANGKYAFLNLIPGTYTITMSIPVGYNYTIYDPNLDNSLNSDAINGAITNVTLSSGQSKLDNDFGVVQAMEIGDFVWEDLNVNGIQDAGEPGIAGVSLTLNGITFDGNNIQASTTTDANGLYKFTNLYPGDYTISINIPADHTPTLVMAGADRDLDSNLSETQNSVTFTATSGDLSIDFGLIRLGSIGDFAWEDMNCNGIQEAGEPGLADVHIRLGGVDIFSNIIDTDTWTDSNGRYKFDNLKPGTYYVYFSSPSGYEFTQAFVNVVDIKSGQEVTNMDAPFFRRAHVGNLVWNDLNSNGLQDNNEPGLDGVKVEITMINNSTPLQLDTLTDAAGYYYFDQLKPGSYDIKFYAPTGYHATVKMAGSDATLDSDVDADGYIRNVTFVSGEQRTDLDAGFAITANASIGDFVWEDINGNGVQNPSEPGIGGVTVNLIGNTDLGVPVDLSTTTDNAGKYIFDNLEAGTYEVMFNLPSGYKFTLANNTSDDLDSDADANTGVTQSIIISATDKVINVDAGMYQPSTIGDFVWNDLNKNGLQDSNEPGIEGIGMNLINVQGSIISNTYSDAQGAYSFSNISPGIYTIRAEIPLALVATIKNNLDQDRNSDFESIGGFLTSTSIIINSNTNNLSVDLGLTAGIGSMSGFAWSDDNGDGVFASNEPLKIGKLVYLLNTSGDTLSTTTTDTQGRYSFDNQSAGQYIVAFQVIAGSLFTLHQSGNNPLIDNDVTGKLIGKTNILDLLGGSDLEGINAGYTSYSSIGDHVWHDKNKDGIQNTDEPGINGFKVYLTTTDGTLIDSTITGLVPGGTTGGYYQFRKVAYGSYKVKFGLVDNFAFSPYIASPSDANSDVVDVAGFTDVIQLAPATHNNDVDAGYYLLTPIAGNIEGRVWQDANNNKVKDTTEGVIAGVNIELHELAGALVATTTSAANGSYQFEDIPFGDYYIQSAIMTDKVFVKYSGISVPNDSDISNDFGIGTTHILSVFPGDTLRNIDIGYASKVTIGDFVWDDLNNDGLQTVGEPGLSNILIRLINESGQVQDSTRSNAAGIYTLVDVPVGKYRLQFEKPTGYLNAFNNNTDPTKNSKPNADTGITSLIDFSVAGTYDNMDGGYVKAGNVGDAVWLDLNGNGIQQANEPGIENITVELYTVAGIKVGETKTFVRTSDDFIGYYNLPNVRPGSYYIKYLLPSNYIVSQANASGDSATDSDITGLNGVNTTDVFAVGIGETITNIDAGAYLPATIGDFVWNDLNKNGAQDTGEPGVANVTVRLFTQSGSLLATTTTNAQGMYSFTGLRQRLYYLQFTIPDGFEFTSQFNSGNAMTDSDVDATGTTPLIALAHGSTFLDVDAGIFVTNQRLIMGTVWDDVNHDGIRTEDEALQQNISVELLNTSQQVLKTFITNHAGMYCVSTAQVGMHYVQVATPNGYIFTEKNASGNPNMDSDVDENGTSDMVMLDDPYHVKYIDAGIYYKPTAILKGVVWLDTNKNGLKDDAEERMKDVVIFLFNKNKIFIKSLKTNDAGQFTFKNLDPGAYYCLLPEFPDLDYVKYTGANQDRDSEFTNQYGKGTSRLITLAAETTTENFDFGYFRVNGISEIKVPETDLILYPNPVISDIQVKLPEELASAQYYILNGQGEIIQQGTIDASTDQLPTDHLRSGKYTLTILSDGLVMNKSFIKIVD